MYKRQRLNGLVGDIDKVAGERLEKRYNAIAADREKSYNTAATLALFVFLLAIVLYTHVSYTHLIHWDNLF